MGRISPGWGAVLGSDGVSAPMALDPPLISLHLRMWLRLQLSYPVPQSSPEVPKVLINSLYESLYRATVLIARLYRLKDETLLPF
ncbi:Hypothetical predicted protein [Pelobates cultripes]|uniref:Uncharacterized protein n=1 Tax=Pelobates cultripes TaxID=61616 RepID=A0AAD1R767_PELCU|nr:Hypothetical predicted protein [Pelobates cultripes]